MDVIRGEKVGWASFIILFCIIIVFFVTGVEAGLLDMFRDLLSLLHPEIQVLPEGVGVGAWVERVGYLEKNDLILVKLRSGPFQHAPPRSQAEREIASLLPNNQRQHHPAPAPPHMRSVLLAEPRVGRSDELLPDGCNLHPLHSGQEHTRQFHRSEFFAKPLGGSICSTNLCQTAYMILQ